VLLSACGGRSGYFKVSGRLANIDQGEFYIYSPDGAIDGIDTIHVTGGRFTYERPCEREAMLLMVFPNFSEQPIFAEPGEKVSIKGDVSHLRDIEIEGTKANNLMTKFRKQTLSSLPQQAREAAARTIADHPESPIGVYLVRRYFLRPPARRRLWSGGQPHRPYDGQAAPQRQSPAPEETSGPVGQGNREIAPALLQRDRRQRCHTQQRQPVERSYRHQRVELVEL